MQVCPEVFEVRSDGYLYILQEHPGDGFNLVRDRLRRNRGRIRRAGSDYLAYALIDALIDSYFPVVEQHIQQLEEMESQLLASPSMAAVRQ